MGKTLFAKLDPALHTNPKIRRGGRLAREVFCFVLCKNAERGATGSIPTSYVEPDYLADQLMTPRPDVEQGLARAIEVGLLAVLDGEIAIVGWDAEHGRGPLSDSERKRNQRARARSSRDVTDGHDESRNARDMSRDARDIEGIVAVDTKSRDERDGHDRSRDAVTVTDQRDQRERSERESLRARTHDPGAPEHAQLARGTAEIAPVDDAQIARRSLGNRAWERLNELRRKLGRELGLALDPLLVHDPGRAELASRIAEAGDRAEALCEHALAVLEHEARAKRAAGAPAEDAVDWLAGKSFGARAWARLQSKPRPPALSKAGAQNADGIEPERRTFVASLEVRGVRVFMRHDQRTREAIDWWLADADGTNHDGPAKGARLFPIGEVTPRAWVERNANGAQEAGS